VWSLERANPTPREGGGVPLDDRRRCGAGPKALDLSSGPLAVVLVNQVGLLLTDSGESPPLSGRGVGAGGTSTTGPPLGPSFFRSPASRLPPLALLRQQKPFSSRSIGGPAVVAAPSIGKRAAAQRCQPSGPPPSLPRASRRAYSDEPAPPRSDLRAASGSAPERPRSRRPRRLQRPPSGPSPQSQSPTSPRTDRRPPRPPAVPRSRLRL